MPEHPNPRSHPHPAKAPARSIAPLERIACASDTPYAELQVTTNFTFLTGASHPEEFARQAALLGHTAIAITDLHTLAGVVRAHVGAKEAGIQLVVGTRLALWPAPWWNSMDEPLASQPASILLYATDRAAYGRMCRLLTTGKRRAPKATCWLTLQDLQEHHEGLLAIALPPPMLDDAFLALLHRLRGVFNDDRLSIGASRTHGPDDDAQLLAIADMAARSGVPMVATNDVYTHVPERRPLQDVLTCIRHGCTIAAAGRRLLPNAERHLKSPDEMARIFHQHPGALHRTIEIAQRCAGFSLDQLRYEYPDEVVPAGSTASEHLAALTWQGAANRYPSGVPDKVRAQLLHELALIAELRYEPYFLTVHDIVLHARSLGILCQGRGAAANSAVCYMLGVTSVDPTRIDMRIATGYLDKKASSIEEARQILENTSTPVSIGLLGNAAELLPKILALSKDSRFRPSLVTDQTSAHDPANGYLPEHWSLERWHDLRRKDPEEVAISAREAIANHVRAILNFKAMGIPCVDYGNNIRQEAKNAGVKNAFDYQGFVPAYVRPLFCQGKGPFRWAALSGDPEDIAKTDAKVRELFPQDKLLGRWLDLAARRIKFQGLPARICWLGLGERHLAGLAGG